MAKISEKAALTTLIYNRNQLLQTDVSEYSC